MARYRTYSRFFDLESMRVWGAHRCLPLSNPDVGAPRVAVCPVRLQQLFGSHRNARIRIAGPPTHR